MPSQTLALALQPEIWRAGGGPAGAVAECAAVWSLGPGGTLHVLHGPG